LLSFVENRNVRGRPRPDVSTDALEEKIMELTDKDGEEVVQSVDIQSFNKL